MPSDTIFESREALETALSEKQNAIGVIFSGDLASPSFEIIIQGQIAQENIRLMQSTLNLIIKALQGDDLTLTHQTTILMPESDPIPLNQNMIPIFMTFEVILLGFMIGAVLIFQSKQEGTIRAYRVSPGGTLVFILSKVILYGALSLVYGLVVVMIIFGFDLNYLTLCSLIVLGSALLTFLGLGIAVFFDNISEWFFAGVIILVGAMLLTLSYAVPVFSHDWINWIPTYQIIFGFRNILFNMGSPKIMQSIFITITLGTLITGGFCYWAIDRKLMREGS